MGNVGPCSFGGGTIVTKSQGIDWILFAICLLQVMLHNGNAILNSWSAPLIFFMLTQNVHVSSTLAVMFSNGY